MFRKREYVLSGDKVLLVPYCAHHVDKYHNWMLDPTLRELTASEPLTLKREYEMQQSWMSDENKCTFIVLSKEVYRDAEKKEIDSMVGDVNLFFSEGKDTRPDYSCAEIDIMIAEHTQRGKGLGTEAAKLLMAYGVTELGVRKYIAKIGRSNSPSINLFRSKLRFTEVAYSEVFKEVTLEFDICGDSLPEYESLCKWTKYVPNI